MSLRFVPRFRTFVLFSGLSATFLGIFYGTSFLSSLSAFGGG